MRHREAGHLYHTYFEIVLEKIRYIPGRGTTVSKVLRYSQYTFLTLGSDEPMATKAKDNY